MKNRIYKSSNGLTMVQSFPYHWQRDSIYYGQEVPYHYFMTLHPMGKTPIYASYTEEDKLLSLGVEGGTVRLKVGSLEEAGEIIHKIVEGMSLNLEGTIYIPTEDNTKAEWIKI